MDVKKLSRDVTPRRDPVDPAKVDELLAIVCRNPEAFDALEEGLTVQAMNRHSKAHGLVWRLVRRHVERYAELPAVGNLRADVTAALSADPDLLADEEVDTLNELVDYIYDQDEHGKDIVRSAAHIKVATDSCRLLLLDQASQRLIDDLVKDGQVAANIPEILQQHSAGLATIDALAEADLDVPFADGWDRREKVKLLSTGVEVLDAFMGGGWRAGECVLFMGPYGSCKTTLTVHGVCGSVKRAVRQFARAKGKGKVPVVVLLFTEGTKDEYRMRLLSHMAQVPWARLNEMESVQALSKAKKPGASPETSYEKELFGSQKKDPNKAAFRCEFDRVQEAASMFNRHLVLIDCTPADEKSGGTLGVGGVPQLAGLLKGYLRKNPDREPASVWLDHASALADRMLDAVENPDASTLQRILKNIPRRMIDMIGKPLGVPVAIMHQFSGAANSRRNPGAVSHHTEAAGCKAMAEYVTFAIGTGTPDNEGLCKFECSKHRRTPPTHYRIVRVVGDFNTVADVSPDYVTDGRLIKSKKEMEVNMGHELVKTKPVSSHSELTDA